MRDELLEYYESELSYLRQMGAEFAEKYPKVASRLSLGANICEDPHVERILEAFSFLAARLHLKLDDDFPEITESLLNVLYPHYLRPMPSMTMVEFAVDPAQGKLTSCLTIPRGALLYSRPVDGVPCRFRTCYETTVPPVRVSQAKWRAPGLLKPALKAPDAVAACSLELSCFPDVLFKTLKLKSLRLYLNGESSLIHSLYELLLNNTLRVVVRNPDDVKSRLIELPAKVLRPVGFDKDDALVPFPRRSFTGYRLLQEYFAFPEKFFYLDLSGLEVLGSEIFTTKAEVIFLIKPFERSDRQQTLELNVSDKTFKLACAPIINLFQQTAEPILMEQTKFEYPVIPDARRRNAMEVFSVDDVMTASPDRREVFHYEPFYGSHHGRKTKAQTFWHANRRASTRANDEGTEMFVSLVDSSYHAARTGFETMTIRCTCTNRDLPSRLPWGNENGDFDLEAGGGVKRIIALQKPTSSLRPPLRRGLQWRLISHLSLNYLSMVEEGRGALQDILRLYNFTDETAQERQISGISGIASKRHFARVVSEHGISFARGVRVELEFDEENFVGSGVYLFASVLEQFLGLYASLNSFSQLVVRTKQRKEVLREWRPRAGQKILL